MHIELHDDFTSTLGVEGVIEFGLALAAAIYVFCISPIIIIRMDTPTEKEFYRMFSEYMQTNYEDVEVLNYYAKDNEEKISITYKGLTGANIVTYVKINGLEKRISCEIRGIIHEEGSTAKRDYTFNIHFYD